MYTVIIFLAILAVLVLSHEFGHFVVARRSGMKVYEFGFGFPPRLFGVQKINGKWRWVWGNKNKQNETEAPEEENRTLYSFNLIPLGGFVRIKGEDGNEAGPDSFSAQKPWKRAITLAAGVAMNVVVATVMLSVGFMIGIPQSAEDLPADKVQDRHIEILQVMKDKPADLAGLKAGDAIIKLDNLENPRLTEMQNYVNEHKDQNISVSVKRGDQIIEKKIKPFVYADTGKGGLGVAILEVGIVHYPWYKAIWYGILTTGFYIKEIFVSFYLLISGLFAGRAVGESLSGPVGIAVMTGQVARLGFAYLLNFTALLSLNLAILNILPIPALDGGRLLFLLISKIKKKPITPKYEQVAHTIGFMVLMLLVLVVTIKDLGMFKSAFISFFQNIF